MCVDGVVLDGIGLYFDLCVGSVDAEVGYGGDGIFAEGDVEPVGSCRSGNVGIYIKGDVCCGIDGCFFTGVFVVQNSNDIVVYGIVPFETEGILRLSVVVDMQRDGCGGIVMTHDFHGEP